VLPCLYHHIGLTDFLRTWTPSLTLQFEAVQDCIASKTTNTNACKIEDLQIHRLFHIDKLNGKILGRMFPIKLSQTINV